MKTTSLAIHGATPLFAQPLICGQHYWPSRDRYQASFAGIFARQYYNNNGPLHQQLESKLATFLGVRHVICTSNAMLALMIAADAMGLQGKVIVPAFAHPGTIQALRWAGLDLVWCDVDPTTHQINDRHIDALIDGRVRAILAVHAWGGACPIERLQKIADSHRLPLLYDASLSFGCVTARGPVGGFGEAEIFSFHEDMILNGGDGGCLATNDDELALRARSIRPSYGLESSARILRVANARLSEAQAAMALMSLDDFPAHLEHNHSLRAAYLNELSRIEGLTVHEPVGVIQSNGQNLVITVDEATYGLSRHRLIAILAAENIIGRPGFVNGCHLGHRGQLPHASHLYQTCMELPLGASVTPEIIARLGDLLGRIRQYAHLGQA